MSKLLRYYSDGQIYFITAVTYQRKRILLDNPEIWLNAINDESYEIIAWIVMHDHFHIILNPRESKPDKILKQIKLKYSHQYRKINGLFRYKLWQARFWDHIIRNRDDFNRHIDYIHYNPVKHSYTDNPFKWEHSSIHKYLDDGYYSDDWGVNEKLGFEGDFGE